MESMYQACATLNIYDMLIKFDTMDECLRSLNWKIKKTIKAQIELDDAP